MRWLACLALSLVASAAAARPGFYVTLGGGASSVSGEEVTYEQFGVDEQGIEVPPGPFLTTDIDGGLSSALRIGYNVKGYAAVEAAMSGHIVEMLDADERQLSGHAHLGVRAYPLWHWQSRLPEYLQPLEPSLSLGWGFSTQVYTPPFALDPVGFSRTGTLRFGLGLEYFVDTYAKLGVDYSYVRASYDNFIFNFEEGINHPVSPGANAGYHQVIASIGFHIGGQSPEPHRAPEPEPLPPAAAPAPAPEVIDG